MQGHDTTSDCAVEQLRKLNIKEESAPAPPAEEDDKKPPAPPSEQGTAADDTKPAAADGTSGGAAAAAAAAAAVTREQLVDYFDKCAEVFAAEETKADLLARRRAQTSKDPARWLLVDRQKEVWDGMLIERDHGAKAVRELKKNFPNDQQLHRKQESFMKMIQWQYIELLRSTRAAVAAEGVELEAKVKMTREQIMDFFEACNALMSLDETKQALEKYFADNKKAPNQMIIDMQRDMLEQLGFDKDFGVSCLNDINKDHEDDSELLASMQQFAMMAQLACREAMVGREEFRRQQEAMRKMQEIQAGIMKEVGDMSPAKEKEFLARVGPVMEAHSKILQALGNEDRQRYLQGISDEERKELMTFQMLNMKKQGMGGGAAAGATRMVAITMVIVMGTTTGIVTTTGTATTTDKVVDMTTIMAMLMTMATDPPHGILAIIVLHFYVTEKFCKKQQEERATVDNETKKQ
eukprot:CAMPEP_0113935036 /NCGR_PEP_ID=MMETSP1339-20121228/2266_1 /TAXON_ID=94617 /ORGANISM="Fibrocapsa japonica" /LENGTH=464 /DNA_ID=CAMNT_0000937049 /DNA_START=77 /DNA_END=1472 /DNA_ORIENTATION=+ /assembly_acc=CAM_ASM_000762